MLYSYRIGSEIRSLCLPSTILVIRDAQMRAFEDDNLRRWVEDYLRTCYPDRCAASRPSDFAALVQNAIGKARRRNLNNWEIRKYVHVVFLLGEGFENQPGFTWAREVLTAPEYNDEGARIRALEDAVLEHFRTDSRASTA